MAAGRKKIGIGIENYKVFIDKNYYYVDKTLLIKELVDKGGMVNLFTRPRRFGKTLNMDMLRTFFEKTNEDTSVYFKDKKIWACGKRYREYQGKYPVIFVTFKDVKKDTWEETYECIVQLISIEYKRHSELVNSTKIQDKDYYNKIVEGTIDKSLFDSSIMCFTCAA